MSEISLYEAQAKKMQGLCDEHELIYKLKKDSYPIVFTLRPMQGMGAQMSMLEADEHDSYKSPDAYIAWEFRDGKFISISDGGKFIIAEEQRNRFLNVCKKLIAYWQQHFFRDVMEKDSLKSGFMPVINEQEADDSGDCLPEGAEPLDTYEDCIELPDNEDLGDVDTTELAEVDTEIAEAIKIVRAENKATVSLLQRRMTIGYSKASRIMDELELRGVVGPYNGAEPREVLSFDEPAEDGLSEEEE